MFRICKIILVIVLFFLLTGFMGLNTNTKTRFHGRVSGVVVEEGDALLLEIGDYLLLETDDKLLLEN